MRNKPNGKTPGKKPTAPLVKRRPVRSFTAMVEILKKRKPQRADAGPGFRTEPVPVRRGRT